MATLTVAQGAQGLLISLEMRHVLSLALSLAVVACQPHVDPNSRPTAESAKARPDTGSAAVRELKKYPFVCGEASCPTGVGVFTALTEVGYATCTGFLVGDRTFVTNRQCLPDALKVRGTTCRGKAAVAFMDHGTTRVIDCKSVLDVSAEERGFTPDFVYLELDGSQAGALPLSREGVADNQALNLWGVSRVEGRHVLSRSTCRSAVNTLLNPYAASPFSSVLVGVGCDAQPGNPGAPLMNARGEVVGLMHSRAPADTVAALKAMFQDQRLRIPETLPKHVNFTNMACVVNPTNGAGPHPNCARAAAARADRCGLSELATDDARTRVMDQIAADLPRIFRFKVTYDEHRRAVVAEPVCVATHKQDMDAWLKYVQLPRWFGSSAIDVTYNGLTKIEGAVATDDALRVKPALTFTRGAGWPQRYQLRTSHSAWSGTISRERGTNQSFRLDVSFQYCTDEQAGGDQRLYRTREGRELTPAEWRQRLEAQQQAQCPK